MPSFKSYCWGLGTTSFRMVEFNKKIEKQLRYLMDFWQMPENRDKTWINNKDTQIRYYEFLLKQGFIEGEANRKDKDAREKTSGLVDLGLINNDRRLTDVGRHLLILSENINFDNNNILQISSDSFIYFKQLLKMHNEIDGIYVRPFCVLAYVLFKLNEITNEEFTFLLPLAINENKLLQIIEQIALVRNNKITIDEIITAHLMETTNYIDAYNLFIDNDVTEDLITNIGMNRKSRNYDKPYYNLYNSLYNFNLSKTSDKVEDVLNAVNKINGKAKTFWKQYIFNTPSARKIIDTGKNSINLNNPLFQICDERSFKDIFFKLLHLFKAKSLLSDYYDLNKRYFKTSSTILFQDNKVKFDIIPNCFFKIVGNDLLKMAFCDTELLNTDCSLEQIDKAFAISQQQIFNKVEEIYGVQARNLYDIQNFVTSERYSRFNAMLNKQFTDEKLLILLNLFENRSLNNDLLIQNMVTNNADIPTIFEYVLAIIWYKISERHGNILEYMNLYLDADLLPITHASGGHEDITYKYDACVSYPKHTLLLEATLANGTNQRRMEMEPVSRHLGEYILAHQSEKTYCVFATTYLHINVVADFRARKTSYYYSSDGKEVVNGMEIIPIQTTELKTLIQKNIKYSELYNIMQQASISNKAPNIWYEEEIVSKLRRGSNE